MRHARASEATLQARLTKAQAALEALNEHKQGKRRLTDVAALRQTAEKIIQRYQVEELLNLSSIESVQEYPVRRH